MMRPRSLRPLLSLVGVATALLLLVAFGLAVFGVFCWFQSRFRKV